MSTPTDHSPTEVEVTQLRNAVANVRELHDELEHVYRHDVHMRQARQLGNLRFLLDVCERIFGGAK